MYYRHRRMCTNLIHPDTNETVFTFLSEFCRPWTGQTVIEVTVLSMILVIAICGNSMVLAAVMRNNKLKSVTNFLVCNLAITDLLFASGIPFIAVTRVTQHWIFGEFVCKFVTYVQFVSGVCSIVTMAMISVERFICVCLLNKVRIKRKETTFVVVVIWILSASFPVPVAISQTVKMMNSANGSFQFCGVEWPDNFQPELYLGFMVTFFFVIPLVVISAFYLRIWHVVKKSGNRTNGSAVNGRSKTSLRKQARLVKMFSTTVALFVIMWLPFFILSFLGVYHKQITSTLFTITLILALANTCQNPVIYGYFDHRLREEFRTMCCSNDQLDQRASSSTYSPQGRELRGVGNNSSTIE